MGNMNLHSDREGIDRGPVVSQALLVLQYPLLLVACAHQCHLDRTLCQPIRRDRGNSRLIQQRAGVITSRDNLASP